MKKALSKIARKYYVKLAVQKAISFFPGKLGFRLNEALVKSLQSHPSDDFFKGRIEKGLKNILLLKEHTNADFKGNILELGTGWHAVDIVIFHILGAKNIFTVDHHCHLNIDYIKNVCNIVSNTNYLESNQVAISARSLIKQDKIEVLKEVKKCPTVQDFFKLLNVRFIQSKSGILRLSDINN